MSSTFAVTASGKDQIIDIIESLEGHLTATVHGEEEDFEMFADAISLLEKKVGRIISG